MARTVRCPECGDSFEPRGLSIHRSRRHGIAADGRRNRQATPRPIPNDADRGWCRSAACAAHPDLPWATSDVVTDEMRTICDGCPVQTACLAWATRFQEVGVYAGTTEADRATPRSRKTAA